MVSDAPQRRNIRHRTRQNRQRTVVVEETMIRPKPAVA
jgi:hypothetical protein